MEFKLIKIFPADDFLAVAGVTGKSKLNDYILVLTFIVDAFHGSLLIIAKVVQAYH